jgi:hypothetical protein
MVAEYVQTDSSSPVAGIRSYFFFFHDYNELHQCVLCKHAH